MIDFKTFRSLIADQFCHCTNCEECMAFFNTDKCPCRECSDNDRMMLAKKLYSLVYDGQELPFDTLWTDEEFTRLLNSD